MTWSNFDQVNFDTVNKLLQSFLQFCLHFWEIFSSGFLIFIAKEKICAFLSVQGSLYCFSFSAGQSLLLFFQCRAVFIAFLSVQDSLVCEGRMIIIMLPIKFLDSVCRVNATKHISRKLLTIASGCSLS